MYILRTTFIFIFLFFSSMVKAQWEETNLPSGRSEISTLSVDDNIYFIGGALSGIERYSKMDVHNIVTGSWSTIELPNSTKAQSCVAIDKKLYIGVWSDRIINIYDTEDNSWSVLDPPMRVDDLVHMDSLLIVGSSGDLAIYNLNTEVWKFIDGPSRSGNTMAATKGKIVLAGGGSSDDARIYDVSLDSWSTAKLSIARNDLRSISHENRLFFIGGEASGFNWVNRIDIYNVDTDTWSIDSLSQARLRFDVTIYKDKLYVVGGQIISFSSQFREDIDILDLNTGSWETIEMPTGRRYPSAVGHENKLYIAGGDNSQNNLDLIEIYNLETSATTTLDKSYFSVYPNPASESINIQSDTDLGQVDIFNFNGELILRTEEVSVDRNIDITAIPSGIYFIKPQNTNNIIRIIKM